MYCFDVPIYFAQHSAYSCALRSDAPLRPSAPLRRRALHSCVYQCALMTDNKIANFDRLSARADGLSFFNWKEVLL